MAVENPVAAHRVIDPDATVVIPPGGLTVTTKAQPKVPVTDPNDVLGQLAKTISRRGALTTEWWSVLLGGAVSALLAGFGVQGSTAAQVAAIVSPIVLAMVYTFVRAHTKGALADALQAVFPQADTPADSPTS